MCCCVLLLGFRLGGVLLSKCRFGQVVASLDQEETCNIYIHAPPSLVCCQADGRTQPWACVALSWAGYGVSVIWREPLITDSVPEPDPGLQLFEIWVQWGSDLFVERLSLKSTECYRDVNLILCLVERFRPGGLLSAC